jgi:hypothetical protein
MTNFLQLEDPSLLHFDSFVGDKWVEAKSGKRFEVVGRNRLFPSY